MVFLRAFEDFFSDIAPFLLIIVFIGAWAIRKKLRHDEIDTFVLDQGGRLVEKVYHIRAERSSFSDEVARKSVQVYYKIKYYDRNGELHLTQLRVDTFFNGVIVESDEIID